MSGCELWREYFAEAIEEGSVKDPGFSEHLENCADCKALFDVYSDLFSDSPWLGDLPAPEGLASVVSGSPCTRWLRRLYAAVDRELGEDELEGLFDHLESCTECRRVWVDLSLIHQIGECLEAPEGLLEACLKHERPRQIRPILGRKTASAAAYFLAVLASLVIGNPVTFARYNQATATVQEIRATVSPGVSAVVLSGRGEFRVMLWRCLRWSEEHIKTIEEAWTKCVGRDLPSASGNEKEGSS